MTAKQQRREFGGGRRNRGNVECRMWRLWVLFEKPFEFLLPTFEFVRKLVAAVFEHETKDRRDEFGHGYTVEKPIV